MGSYWVKAIQAGIFCSILFLGVGSALPEVAAVKQPKVEINPSSYDFGTVNEGDKATAVFNIKNTGDADLIIYDAKPSCGCTVAKLSSKDVKPGETATLEAVYNSINASGQVHKNIAVSTNDPKSQMVNLPITGTVKALPSPDIMLSSFNVTNLQLSAGGKETRSIKISNTGVMELVISEVSTTPGITVTIDGQIIKEAQTVKMTLALKPGETKVMDVTVTPKGGNGGFQEFVTIRSNSKHRPVVTFVAQGVVQG
jgi:hypothetical protein